MYNFPTTYGVDVLGYSTKLRYSSVGSWENGFVKIEQIARKDDDLRGEIDRRTQKCGLPCLVKLHRAPMFSTQPLQGAIWCQSDRNQHCCSYIRNKLRRQKQILPNDGAFWSGVFYRWHWMCLVFVSCKVLSNFDNETRENGGVFAKIWSFLKDTFQWQFLSWKGSEETRSCVKPAKTLASCFSTPTRLERIKSWSGHQSVSVTVIE